MGHDGAKEFNIPESACVGSLAARAKVGRREPADHHRCTPTAITKTPKTMDAEPSAYVPDADVPADASDACGRGMTL